MEKEKADLADKRGRGSGQNPYLTQSAEASVSGLTCHTHTPEVISARRVTTACWKVIDTRE